MVTRFSVPYRLTGRDNIRNNVVVFEAPHSAGAAQSCLNLVGDADASVGAYPGINFLEVIFRCFQFAFFKLGRGYSRGALGFGMSDPQDADLWLA